MKGKLIWAAIGAAAAFFVLKDKTGTQLVDEVKDKVQNGGQP